MSSESENSQTSSDSTSESSELLNFEIEDEDLLNEAGTDAQGAEWSGIPNVDDPVADEAYVAEYRRHIAERNGRMDILKGRYEQRVNVSDWCKCGHCSLAFTQCKEELSCCTELQKCKDALTDERVLADIEEGRVLQCITEHPGFPEVCLAKWSLGVAAAKFYTRSHERYRQKRGASEEKFLRSVSYRQFTEFVYGQLGKKRIPLPSCAYTAIRRRFDLQEGEEFTGYKDQEKSD